MHELSSAALLGIVEGLTEFLPVSSTGHLILVGDLISLKGEKVEFFDVFIQLGAILAVLLLYHRRFAGLLRIRGGFHTQGFEGTAGILKIGVACLPAFVLGALLHGFIKERLFSSLTVAAALLVGAFLMIWAERGERRIRSGDVGEIRIKDAFLIGLAQCLALWPGMSRSACTIVGGLLCGLERRVAAEFSFLVAVPVMFAAVAFDAYKSLSFLEMADLPFYLTGFIVSFVSALVAVRVFIALLGRFTLVPFAWYRIVLAGVVMWWVWG